MSGDKAAGSDTISAAMEGASSSGDTRLSLKGPELVWEEGDQITVVGSSTTTFSLTKGAGTTSAEFLGSFSAAGEEPYYALIPLDASANRTNGNITFAIPQNKTATTGDIGRYANPIVGKIVNGSVSFKNLFGLLKLNVKLEEGSPDVNIRKITLHDLGGNMLWGTCTVPIKDGSLDYTDISMSGGDNTISIVWSGYTTLTASSPTSIYFAVPPGSLDRGFSVVFYDDSGKAWTFIQKVSGTVQAERSVIINFKTVELVEKSEPKDEKARGYYKTLFIDGAQGLNHLVNKKELPWTGVLSESDIEYVANGKQNRDYATAYGVLVKSPCTSYGTGSGYTDVNWEDDNGVLLYPDGEPRFRAVFVNGGSSSTHGTFLTQDGRSRFHDFFTNGGSYIAVCAGTFLASTSVDGTNHYNGSETNYTFGIWPGNLTHTTMPKSISEYGSIYTDLKAEQEFGSFSKDATIGLVRHHGGSFLGNTTDNNKHNPERLFSYQFCQYDNADEIEYLYTDYNRRYRPIFGGSNGTATVNSRVNETAIWAYKKDGGTGRAVLCGSHPESPATSPEFLYSSYNEQISLMQNMMEYALGGVGNASVKSSLESGVGYTPDCGIGDRQYHHYCISTDGIADFTLQLESNFDESSGVDLYLAMRQQKSEDKTDFAWISDADYVLCNQGGQKVLNIKSLSFASDSGGPL